MVAKLRHPAEDMLRTRNRHNRNLQMWHTRHRTTPMFTHRRFLSMQLHLGDIQRRCHQEGMQRRSDSLATHSRKEVVHRLLHLFNLLLRPLQRNSRLKFLLRLGDFAALSNTANGRRQAEWKHREAWPHRVGLWASMA